MPARRGCATLVAGSCRSKRSRSAILTGGLPYDRAGDGRAGFQQKLAAQGITWREEARDTFKAGEPETPVRGIATTGMATFDVLQARPPRTAGTSSSPTSRRSTTTRISPPGSRRTRRISRSSGSSPTTAWSSGGSTITRMRCGRIRWSPARRARSGGRSTRRRPSRASMSLPPTTLACAGGRCRAAPERPRASGSSAIRTMRSAGSRSGRVTASRR